MTADETRLKASFIQWDIPTKKQKDLCPIYANGEAARMDAQHVTFTALGEAALNIWYGKGFPYYEDKYVNELKTFPQDNGGPHEVVIIDRKILMRILDNMDSDYVKIKVKTDAPIRLFGQIGETPAGAAIAPRIDSDPERIE